MAMPRIKRRTVLIDRFQYWLVGVELGHLAIVALIFVCTLFTPVVLEFYRGSRDTPEVHQAARDFLFLNRNLWLPMALAVVLFALHNVIVSHRIAGPLYRLRVFMKAVADGDLSQRIRLRDRDRLQNEAEVANQMVSELDDRMTQLSSEIARARRVWSSVELAGSVTTSHMQEMRSSLESCEEVLEGFKTRGVVKPIKGPRAVYKRESAASDSPERQPV